MATTVRAGHRAMRAGAVRLPATLLGVGLGAFVDGIVLHQILQWHHMVSAERSPATLAGLEHNTLADGFFHAVAWLAVVVGVALLATRREDSHIPQPALWGWVLFGWGLFNVIDGVVNHFALGLHHVRDDLGGPLGWDVGFLAVSVALMVAGWLMQRRAA
jgi:uncharacterized membrane protein